jgi:hypothetical protein
VDDRRRGRPQSGSLEELARSLGLLGLASMVERAI